MRVGGGEIEDQFYVTAAIVLQVYLSVLVGEGVSLRLDGNTGAQERLAEFDRFLGRGL